METGDQWRQTTQRSTCSGATGKWKRNRAQCKARNGHATERACGRIPPASWRPQRGQNSCQRRPNRLTPDGVRTSMDGSMDGPWLKPPRCTHGRTDGTEGPAVGRGWRSPSRRFVNGTSAGRYAMGAPPTRRFQILNNKLSKNVVTIIIVIKVTRLWRARVSESQWFQSKKMLPSTKHSET